MAATFCRLYEGSGSTYPIQTFPKSLFPFLPNRLLTEKAKAWNFYEQVESYDAAVRSRGRVSGWYVFVSEGDRLRHRDGQLLHSQLCPTIRWTSQRNLGPATSTNVYPDPCEK